MPLYISGENKSKMP